jgi:DNA-binding winged helix-turn-helix (wHTH) protein
VDSQSRSDREHSGGAQGAHILPTDACAGFRIGQWAVEPSLNRLFRDGAVVRIEPKVMDVLVKLAERPGRVVPKEELVHVVWGREFLAQSVLTRAVAELRRLLEDDAHTPRYIETIPKRGYRLIAPLKPLGEVEAGALPTAAPSARRPTVVWLAAAALVAGAALGWLSFPPRKHHARHDQEPQ